jgi:hypothetical protein
MFDKVDHDMSRMIEEAVFKLKGEVLRRKSESLKTNGMITNGSKLTRNGAMSDGDEAVV